MPSPDPIDDARGSEDWAPGDLALCRLDSGELWYDSKTQQLSVGPPNRWVGEVKDVKNYPALIITALVFAEWPDPDGYDARYFIKIKPLSDDEKREFEADLRHDQREPAPVSLEVDSSSWIGLDLATRDSWTWYTGIVVGPDGPQYLTRDDIIRMAYERLIRKFPF